MLTFTAAPDAGSTWQGWTGACTGPSTSCTVTAYDGLLVVANVRATSTSGVFYYHLDALGSVRTVTDASGAVVERHDYRPFGEDNMPLPADGADPTRFIGQPRDGTKLDYFHARYYSMFRGRFQTVDPGHANANVFDGQSWNAYVYGGNNPLRFVDPSGLCNETTTYLGNNTYRSTTHAQCNSLLDFARSLYLTSFYLFFGSGGGGDSHTSEPRAAQRAGGRDIRLPPESPPGQPPGQPPGNPSGTSSDQGCPTEATAKGIDQYLQGKSSPMVGEGVTFSDVGREYDLDPRLLVSISGAETTFGRNITAGTFNALNILYNGFKSHFRSFASNIKSAGRSLTNPINQYDLSNTATMYSTYCNGVGCAAGLKNINLFMVQQKAQTDALHYPCKDRD